jgi:hypothetical protein
MKTGDTSDNMEYAFTVMADEDFVQEEKDENEWYKSEMSNKFFDSKSMSVRIGKCVGCDGYGAKGTFCDTCDHFKFGEKGQIRTRKDQESNEIGRNQEASQKQHLHYSINFESDFHNEDKTDFENSSCCLVEQRPNDDVIMSVGVNPRWGGHATKKHTSNNLWLLDSGATLHVTNNYDCLRDPVDVEKDITVGNGEVVSGTKKGWVELTLGGDKRMILQEVIFVPNFMKNIVSVNRLCSNGTQVIWQRNKVILKSPSGKAISVPQKGTGMYYLRNIPTVGRKQSDFVFDVENKTKNARERTRVMDVNVAHALLGHPSEETTRMTMKYYGVVLTGKMNVCAGCAIEKASKKGSPKAPTEKASKPCERLLLDTTGPYPPSLRGNRYDVYIMCQATNKRWILNVKNKNQVPKCLEQVLKWTEGHGYKVKYLRCDNAGEHQSHLRDVCDQHGVLVEYTARATPQQNGQVERMIATDRGRRNAMMNGTNFSSKELSFLRAEATQMSSQLAQLLVSTNQPIPAAELVPTGTRMLKPENLKFFGQKGYVYVKKNLQNKMAPRAREMFMVGYADNHSGDTYRMYDPKTKSVILTRDVKWAQNQHFQKQIPQTPVDMDTPINVPGFEIPLDDEAQPVIPFQAEEIGQQPVNTHRPSGRKARDQMQNQIVTRKPEAGRKNSTGGRLVTDLEVASNVLEVGEEEEKVDNIQPAIELQPRRMTRELANLHTAVNYERANNISDNESIQDDEDDDEKTVVALTDYVLLTAEGEPRTISEALAGPENKQWQRSIKNEVENFLNRGAWEEHKMEEIINQGHKPIGTKTVFKIKTEHDGSKKYKTRIVSLGYNMKPGEHFHNSFSPVATDMSIRMILAIGLGVMNEERSPDWKRVKEKWRGNKSQQFAGKEYKRFKEKVGEKGRERLPLCFGAQVDNPNPWVLEMFDVEAAFLNADPGVKIFIKVPEAMVKLGMISQEEADGTCFRLLKTMYGNVDAALRFFIKYKSILRDMEFQQCQTDPCIFVKRNVEGIIVMMLATHVDDTLVSGRKEEIMQFYTEFEKHLKIERLGQIRKHLGVWWTFCEDESGEIYLKADMEDMREDIITKFEQLTGKAVQEYQTPAYPNNPLVKNDGEPIWRTEYQSFIGQILYYTTKIAPPMANAVRELSSHMSNPSKEHWKALERTIGYLKGHGRYEFTLRAPEELRGVHIRDANYATCEETRRSISGGIETLGGTIVGYSSKKQNVVSLSSAEAELISYTEGCQNARFMQQLLGEIIGYEPTGIIFEDNLGCIFLIKNQKTSSRTKHLAVRHLFGRDLYIENKVLPAFVRSEENVSDGLTKN